MNIFAVDYDPSVAAIYLCDKHVIAMTKESAQILCTVAHNLDPSLNPPYKPTHRHHPVVLWAQYSKENYKWLLSHSYALSLEYRFRYKANQSEHRSSSVIRWALSISNRLAPCFPSVELSPFTLAIPLELKERLEEGVDPVYAYRAFYCLHKSRFAKWEKGRRVPYWYNPGGLPLLTPLSSSHRPMRRL